MDSTSKRRRYFAIGPSDGPDTANLQKRFWKHAINHFNIILDNWSKHSVSDDESPMNEEYTINEFVVDAAVTIVLAATSITELAGQNIEPEGERTPEPKSALKRLLSSEYDSDVDDFINVYDALRHFGPAKYAAIDSLTEDKLCEYMSTAQRIWQIILFKQGLTVDDEFNHDFKLE